MKPNPLNPLFAKWTFRICGSLRACRTPDKVSGLWFRDPAWTEAPQALCRASIQLIHNHFPCKMSFNAQDKTCMNKREKNRSRRRHDREKCWGKTFYKRHRWNQTSLFAPCWRRLGAVRNKARPENVKAKREPASGSFGEEMLRQNPQTNHT